MTTVSTPATGPTSSWSMRAATPPPRSGTSGAPPTRSCRPWPRGSSPSRGSRWPRTRSCTSSAWTACPGSTPAPPARSSRRQLSVVKINRMVVCFLLLLEFTYMYLSFKIFMTQNKYLFIYFVHTKYTKTMLHKPRYYKVSTAENMCCFVCLRMKQSSAFLLVLKIVIRYDRNFTLIFNFLHLCNLILRQKNIMQCPHCCEVGLTVDKLLYLYSKYHIHT